MHVDEGRIVADGLGFRVASFQLEPAFRVLAESGGAVDAHAPFGFLLERGGYLPVAFLVGLGVLEMFLAREIQMDLATFRNK